MHFPSRYAQSLIWGARFVISLVLTLVALPVEAQAGGVTGGRLEGPSGGKYETRAELTALAEAAEREGRAAEAGILRARLRNGDFQEGDRIVVALDGRVAALDTVTVRSGKVIQLARMDDLTLEGVLRSELQDALRTHIARYINDPTVRATPLLRLAVTGKVRSPGFYYSAADVVLSDLIMLAGGPDPDADLNKIVVRRGTDVLWDAPTTRSAISEGLSADRLHLRAGDEVFVGERRRFPLQAVSMALAVVLTIVNLGERFIW